MNEAIKITKGLEFDFQDLMRDVDLTHKFTLRDVLRACMDSKIPMEMLKPIVRCGYIEEYWEEAESKDFEKEDDGMEFLELYWMGDVDKIDEETKGWSGFEFHGVGVEEDGFRQAYAVEWSPMYKLADYPIEMKNEIYVSDWSGDNMKEGATVLFTPSITLINLIHSILWELSFLGSPAKRNMEIEEMMKTCNELDEAREDGTEDEITTPHEEVKKKMLNKFKED